MIKPRIKCLALALIFILPLSALAQKRPLSLEEAIALGLEASPGLHASQMKVESQAAKTREAEAGRLPSLKFGAGYVRLSEVPPFEVSLPIFPHPIVVSQNYFNNFALRLGFQQPVFTGFRLKAGAESARMLAESAGQDMEKDRAEFIFAVKNAYWGLTRAREFEKVIAENIRQVGEHLKDARAFFEQGLLTKNDVLRVEHQLSNAEIMSIEARNAAAVALAALNNLIGQPLDTDVDLTTSVDSLASRIPPEEDLEKGSPVEAALSSRPDLKSAEFRIKASESAVRAAQAGYYPQIFLSGNYYYLRPNSRFMPAQDKFNATWDFGISFSLDIWNWGQTKSQTEQARAQLAQAQDARKLLADQIALEVTQCRLDLVNSRDKLRVAGLAVVQAEENLRETRERFKEGVALNTDVLDAEVDLLQSRLVRTQAAIDLVLDQARLEKALGY
jgi:outer membrane protein